MVRSSLAAMAFFAALAFSSLTHAAQKDELLGIVTGPKTGTYYAFGKDIAIAANKMGIDVDIKDSEGSIDNIKRINSSENAALGIIQSDVLGFLSRSKSPESMKIARNLRLVYPFYNEEVHVLARREIADFAGLQGKNVAIGEEGSGNMLTSINLFSVMGVVPAEMKKIPSAEGVVAVLKGELDAVIFVGGKPVRLFKNLEDLTLPENQKYADMLSQVRFLPLDSPKLLEEYRPGEITQNDYIFVTEKVPTVAVQAVMVSFDFSQTPNKKRCKLLTDLAKAIRTELPYLREHGHPKWKEVDLDSDSGLWKKDGCAWPVESPKASAEKAEKAAKADKKALMNILEKR
jgi:TRAP transporter TAXI family solute receptor